MSQEVVSARTLRRVENKLLRVLAVIEERQRVIEKDLEQIRKYVAIISQPKVPRLTSTFLETGKPDATDALILKQLGFHPDRIGFSFRTIP